MKSIVTKLKKNALHIAVLVGIVGLTVGVLAQNGSEVVPFLGDSGLQNKYGRLAVTDLASTDPSAVSAATSEFSDLRLFVEKPSVFSDIEVSGTSYIDGYTRFGSNTPYTISTVSVEGNIMATDLVDLGNTSTRYICADGNGAISLCAEGAESYSWNLGTWGSCTGASLGSCSGTYSGPGSSCNGTYAQGSCQPSQTSSGCGYNYIHCNDSGGSNPCTDPGFVSAQATTCAGIGSQSSCNASSSCTWTTGGISSSASTCSAYTTQLACDPIVEIFPNGCTWETGSYVSCAGPGDSTSCYAQGGGIYSTCTWDQPTLDCSGPTSSSLCTAQDASCIWNIGGVGSQTRTVSCEDSGGSTVADGFCESPKPDVSQSC